MSGWLVQCMAETKKVPAKQPIKEGTYFNCEISGQKALGGLIHENNRPIRGDLQ